MERKLDELSKSFEYCIENYTRDQVLDFCTKERDKKIGLILYGMGYNDAMKHATEMVKVLK